MAWPALFGAPNVTFHNNSPCIKGLQGKQHQQQHRNLTMLVGAPLASLPASKSFTNPNFVNEFDKQNIPCPLDISAKKSNIQNSRSHKIIDNIKVKCPEVIPSVRDDQPMCLTKTKTDKRKQSKITKKDIEEMMEKDNVADNVLPSPATPPLAPSTLILGNFLQELPPLKMLLTKAISMSQSRLSSCSDEDSFIEFSEADNESSVDEVDNANCPSCFRGRLPSMCESEDSFIMFQKSEGEENEDKESCVESHSEEDDTSSDEEDSEYDAVVDHNKKVRFASANNLCEIHPMIKWAYAYQAARKGPWEMYARDRCRFKDRALRVEQDIKWVLKPDHRTKIYKERFESL